jgi:dTDP-4-dehydrorhamnose reductase
LGNDTIGILGASGMLGSMMLDVLSRDKKLKLIATVREEELAAHGRNRYKNIEWQILDAEDTDLTKLVKVLGDASWVINNIGIIKPYIHDDNPEEVERAITVNSLFPHKLAHAAALTGTKVLQIATDCVYSGAKGQYVETDLHDALDVYGKTKSLGETHLSNVYHLRCSIIGPEPNSYLSLLEWFRRQPQNAQVKGFTNHQWNGVTTFHFANICRGIITTKNMTLPHLQHVVPAGIISKAELLEIFAKEYQRWDITINPVEAKIVIDRTLATKHDSQNQALWAAAGYSDPPSIPQMVSEMAAFEKTKIAI